jgi:hypothetical protein
MLTRGGGVTAIQKVVAKVSDLPSPLDAQPGERIIVRETEEVYALDTTTRMWSVIGVLKKVGGARPEDLKAHIDAEGNPHKTTLGQIVAQGAAVQLDDKSGELVLNDKSGKLKTLLRLLKTNGALRVGPDAGSSTAALWVNAGRKGAQAPILRIVDDGGEDRALLDGDGNLKTVGTAEFKGGISGKTKFSDTIGAPGIDGGEALALSGKKVSLGPEKNKAILSERGLGLGKEPTEALDVAGNLKVDGTVSSDLSPSDDHKQSLGSLRRRWKVVSAATLGVLSETDETAIIVGLKPGQKAPIILVGSDTLVLDHDGDLGLGTSKPDSTLDVRGSGITIGAPVGKARVSLADDDDGNVQLSFNRLPDDTAEDSSLYSWSIIPGNGKTDAVHIRRRSANGEWLNLFQINKSGVTVAGDLTIGGTIKTQAPLSGDALHGSASGGKNKITLETSGASIGYHADGELRDGAAHTFSGTWQSQLKALTGLLVDITDRGSDAKSSLLKMALNKSSVFDFRKDGTLLGGQLGTENAPWSEASLAKSLSVAGLKISKGRIESDDALELAVKAVGLRNNLTFTGKDVNHIGALAGKLGVVNADATKTIFFNLDKNYGIDFTMGGAQISGVAKMKLDNLTTGTLDIDSPSDKIAGFGCKGSQVLSVRKNGASLNGALSVNGLVLDKLQEQVEISGSRVETKFKIPAGVRVEAVVATVVEDIAGATFFQIGDASTPDRFLSPSTKLSAGLVSKGLNHCDRGQSVQQTEAPVVITTGAAPTAGKLLVTVHFVNPVI